VTGWTYFCRSRDVPTGGHVTKWVESLRDEITVFRRGGELLARSTVCPHNGGEFDIDLAKNELRCRWHGWRFAIDSGSGRNSHFDACLREYRSDETEGEIRVTR